MKDKFRNTADGVLCVTLCSLTLALIYFSEDAREGAKKGLGLCEGIIIPSLLGVLCICNFIIKSRLSRVIEAPFGFVFEKLLRLPRQCAAAVILGLISGYPSGALLTCSLFERKIIDTNTAKRIMSFNFCGGAAFIVTAVGTVIFGSTKEGVIIYLSNIAASLTVAVITGIKNRRADFTKKRDIAYPSNTEALCEAVESAVRALAVMCAYIMLFSVFSNIIIIPKAITPLFEITNGIYFSDALPCYAAAAYVAFGGACVHMQILPFLSKMKIRYKDFLFGRIICSALSFIYCRLFTLLFPEASAVFNNISERTAAISSGGRAFSVLMVIGCAVIVFDFENKKIKLHS